MGDYAMRKTSVFGAFVCVSVLFVAGCDQSVEPPTVSEEVKAQIEEEEAKAAEEEAARNAAGEEYMMKVAGVGATGKGDYGVTSEEAMSIITVPISTYFQAQERAVFDMQIPHTMNLFQATEGRYPNSEEEFFQRIIKENQIQLPKLPEGDSYVYDVPSHTLMIKTKR